MSAVRRIALVARGARIGRDRLDPLEAAGFELVERYDVDKLDDVAVLTEAFAGVWATIAGSERYSRALFERLGGGLQAVGRFGVGYDTVDVAAASDHGVRVLTTPGANADAVADLALALMLACRRRLPAFDAAVRTGAWRPDGLAADLTGATVGIVGLGAIGRAVARRLHGFGCRILAVEPQPDAALCGQLAIECCTLEDLLPRVDVLTLHAPLTSETTRLIGARELARLKPGAVLVNTSRGLAVDEQALVQALEDGQLAGAGLDVFEREPLAAGHPLTRHANVVLSGHVASYSTLGMRQTIDAVVAGLLALDRGEIPAGCVNPPRVAPR